MEEGKQISKSVNDLTDIENENAEEHSVFRDRVKKMQTKKLWFNYFVTLEKKDFKD